MCNEWRIRSLGLEISGSTPSVSYEYVIKSPLMWRKLPDIFKNLSTANKQVKCSQHPVQCHCLFTPLCGIISWMTIRFEWRPIEILKRKSKLFTCTPRNVYISSGNISAVTFTNSKERFKAEPSGRLVCSSSLIGITGLNSASAWTSVSYEYRVLSGRCFCDWPIPRLEDSESTCVCVCVCD